MTIPSDGMHKQRYADAIQSAAAQGIDEYQSWFNRAASVEQATVRGFWDFACHVLTPAVVKHLSRPEEKVALEIGYGGGRLLNAACHFFKAAIGIDVHTSHAVTEKFLAGQGVDNFSLLSTDGRSIPVADASIDFVYSFIVLQHLPSMAALANYVAESYRCLKAGGVAQLYVGKFNKLSKRQRIRCMLKGYQEIVDAPVNHTSLVVRLSKMRELCRASGFTVVDSGTSYKNIPDGYPDTAGGQVFVTLVRR